ncbi:Polycystic kidney disease protein 1-like [Mactra antiquata]
MQLILFFIGVFCIDTIQLLETGTLSTLHTELSAYFVTGIWQASAGVNPPEVNGLLNVSVIRDNKPDGQICVEHYYCPTNDTRMFFCGFGFYNNNTDGTSPTDCLPCPPGKYCYNGMYECETGYYCPGQGLGIQPHHGYYAPNSGMSAPLKCPKGTYQSKNNLNVSEWTAITMCTPCPQRKYCDEPGLPGPAGNCHDGWFCIVNETSPQPDGQFCPPGQYCVQGLMRECQVGYYQPKEAMALCFECPVGSYCNDTGLANVSGTCEPGWDCYFTVTMPTICPAGHMCNDGNKVRCPRGYYQPNTGQSFCHPCPVGYFCSKQGLTAPEGTCKPGCCLEEAQISNISCPVGIETLKFTFPGTSDCVSQATYHLSPPLLIIDEFRFSVKANNSVRIYVFETDAYGSRYIIHIDIHTRCKYEAGDLSYINSYHEDCDLINTEFRSFWLKYFNSTLTQFGSGEIIGQNVVFSLNNVHSFQNVKFASTSNTSTEWIMPKEYATDCAKGYYKQVLGPCLPCPAGTYCPVSGMSKPKQGCDHGYYCDSGAYTPTPHGKYCPRGYQCKDNRPEPCETKFIPGNKYAGKLKYYYNPHLFKTSCSTLCPRFFNCTEPGKFHLTEICKPGYYCSGGYIFLCEPGNYCYLGQKIPCPEGFTALAGQDKCDRCTNDTYCTQGFLYPCPDNFICENGLLSMCKPGLNCNFVNDTSLPCQPGYHHDNISSECIPCPEGTYQPNNGNQQCLPCSPGFYCVTHLLDKEYICWMGHYCPLGSGIPIPCPSGYYQPSTQQSDCLLCPEGHYCNQPNAATNYCHNCPTHGVVYPTHCPTGISCPPGTEEIECDEDAYDPGELDMTFEINPRSKDGYVSVRYPLVFTVQCDGCDHVNTTITWSIRECLSEDSDSCAICLGYFDILPINGTEMVLEFYDKPYLHTDWSWAGVFVKVQRGSDNQVGMRYKIFRFMRVSPYINCTTVPSSGFADHTNFSRSCSELEVRPPCDFICDMFFQSTGKVKHMFHDRGNCNDESFQLPLGDANKDFKATLLVKIRFKGLLLWEDTQIVQIKHKPLTTAEVEEAATLSIQTLAAQDQNNVALGSILELKNVASILNSAEVVPSSTTTTGLEVTTPIGPTVSTTMKPSIDEDNAWKEKKIKIRDDIVELISNVNTSASVENITNVAEILNTVTQQKDEISQETKIKSVEIYSTYTEQLKQLEDTSEDDKVTDTAMTLLFGMASMIDLVNDDYREQSYELGEQERFLVKEYNPQISIGDKQPDVTPTTKTVTTTSTNMKAVQLEHEAAINEVKNMTAKLFHHVEDISTIALKHLKVDNESKLIDTPFMSLSLDKHSPDNIQGRVLKTERENADLKTSMKLPEDFNVSNVDSISTLFMYMTKNPFVWDESSKLIDPPVVSLDLKDDNNSPFKVSYLSSPMSSELSTAFPLLLRLKKSNGTIQLVPTSGRPCAATLQFNMTVNHLLSVELMLPPGISSARLSIRTDKKLSFKEVINIGFRFPEDKELIEELYGSAVASYVNASDFNDPEYYCNSCAEKCCNSSDNCTGIYTHCMYYCTYVINASVVLECVDSFRSLKRRTKLMYCRRCYDICCEYPDRCNGIYTNCVFLCNRVLNEPSNSECQADYKLISSEHNIDPLSYCETCFKDCCPPTQCSGLYHNCVYYCNTSMDQTVTQTCQSQMLEAVDFLHHTTLYCFVCYAQCCSNIDNCDRESYWNCVYYCNDVLKIPITDTCIVDMHNTALMIGMDVAEYCDSCHTLCCYDPIKCDNTFSSCLYFCKGILNDLSLVNCTGYINLWANSTDLNSTLDMYCDSCFDICCIKPTSGCEKYFSNCIYYCTSVLGHEITSGCEANVIEIPKEIEISNSSAYCEECEINCCNDLSYDCTGIYSNCIYVCHNYLSGIINQTCLINMVVDYVYDQEFKPIFLYPRSSLFAENQTSFVLYFGISLDLHDPNVIKGLKNLDKGCIGNASQPECIVDIGFQIPVGVNDIGCMYWDNSTQTWSAEGLKLDDGSGNGVIKCTSDHLSSFSKSVIVVPAYVDPLGIDLYITVFENPVVVTMVIVVWVLYFFLIHWARRSDKHDEEKIGVMMCPDNIPSEKYAYIVCVTTGWWGQAGTTSNVYICLTGSHGNSSSKCLSNNFRKCFQTGHDDWFLITTEHSLGDLQNVTLWHDNTGDNPHWFINQLYVKDIQTDGAWTFIYNDWLAVDRGNLLMTTTVIQAVTQNELNLRKKYSLQVQSSKDIRNSHLWISIFSKSPSSSFTRVQRLTCALSWLLTTMLTNVMFYGVPLENDVNELHIGDFKFSFSQIIIGIESGLIVFPLNLLIVQMFLRTRQRHRLFSRHSQSHTKITLRHVNRTGTEDKNNFSSHSYVKHSTMQQKWSHVSQTPETDGSGCFNCFQSENQTLQNFVRKINLSAKKDNKGHTVTMVNCSKNRSIDVKLHGDIYRGFKSMFTNTEHIAKYFHDDSQLQAKILARKAQQFAKQTESIIESRSDGKWFPWWFVYVAWIFTLSICIISSYFVMLYGLKYGYTMSMEWLVSFFTGFFKSVFILQPLKVISITVVVILILNKTVDVEESLILIDKDNDEDYLKSIHVDKSNIHQHLVEPLPRRLTKQIRQRLQVEWLMDKVIWDMMLHCLYFLVFLVIVYGQRNIEQAYQTNVVVRNLFASPTDGISIHEVSTYDDFFTYLEETLVPGMTVLHSNHEDAVLGSDHYLVGTYRLRQHRVKPEVCEENDFGLHSECKGSIRRTSDEECRNFLGNWSMPLPSAIRIESGPWKWQSATELQTMSYTGEHGYYSGGGYVLEMTSDVTTHLGIFNDLKSYNWIDSYTRVIFIEFTLYNPNVNLFTAVICAFEFTNTGQIFPSHHEFTSNLYLFTSGFTRISAMAQIAFILFNLSFVCVEIKKFKREGWKLYFSNFWSYVDIVQISLAIAVLGLFIKRLVVVDLVLDEFRNSNGNRFVSFYSTIFWDFTVTYSTACIITLLTVKCVRMLKFNKRLGLVMCTIDHVKGSLLASIFMFIIVSFAFTSLANLCFGRHDQYYKSFYASWYTNIRILLGEFDFAGLQDKFSVLGPFYVVVFVFIVSYIFLYMMMTVLNIGLIETIYKLRTMKNKLELLSYIIRKIKLILNVK